MVLALAVLSGVGMDVMVESHGERHVRRVLAIGFAGMAVVIGIIWLVARRGLTPSQASIRAHSFIWPAIEVVTGLVVVWVLARVATRSWTRLSPSAAGTLAGSVLLLVLTAFLVASGAPIYSSSSDYPTSTPAVASLQRVIGNSVVGIGGTPTYPSDMGIMVNANLLYDVQEFGAYDPLLPHAYFSLYETPVSEIGRLRRHLQSGHHLHPGCSTLRDQLSARTVWSVRTQGLCLRSPVGP